MGRIDTLTNFVTDIADSIRERKSSSGLIPAANFTDEILSIEGGGGGGTEWQPNPTWFDIESIIKNDTSGYRKKYIMLLPDVDVTTSLSFTNANVKPIRIITSDGATYNDPTTGATTWSFSHTWNTDIDKESDSIFKTRWFMVYYDNSIDDSIQITLQIATTVLYMIIDTIKFAITNFSNKNLLYTFKLLNESNLRENTTSMSTMFSNCYSLQSIPLLNTESANNMSNMFSNCYSLQSIPLLNTTSANNMAGMFQSCYSLQSIHLLNTEYVETTSAMFSNCASLQSIPLLNTAKVTNMSTMFSGCYSLKNVPLLNTASVTSMNTMFSNCYSLQSIPLLNTAKVTNMGVMFSSCYSLKNVPLLNTASVTIMNNMFSNCYSLQSIPLLNTTSATNVSNMFNNCASLIAVFINSLNISLILSASSNLNRTSLLYIINNLTNRTSLTAQTLTLGATNQGRLTASEIAIATNKNWTIA